jgi:hypothetical protein
MEGAENQLSIKDICPNPCAKSPFGHGFKKIRGFCHGFLPGPVAAGSFIQGFGTPIVAVLFVG